jgi:hypothetical protein
MESKDLLALSETFSQPFGTLDRVRRTMSRLEAARQVHSWRFAMTGEGGGAAPLYYKLTLEGFRTLYQNEDALPPTKRYLHEIGPGRHRHQQSLTKFIVKTHVSAHRSGLRVMDSYAENTFRIETPLGFLFPDQRFTLAIPSAQQFTNCIELDNSTESIWSQKESHSIEMKMRKYLSNLAACNFAYRVQFVVTGARQRKDHILDAAARLQPSIDFAPFYVVHLDDYLSAVDPFLEPIFASPRNHSVALFRSHAQPLTQLRKARSPALARSPFVC